MLSPVSHSNKFQNVRIFCCCYYCSITKLYLTLCDSWTVASQAPLSSIISQNLFKFMNFKSIVLSNHLILCHPLLMPSCFLGIWVFLNELALCIRWPKYWIFSFTISPMNIGHPMNIQGWFPLVSTGLISLFPKNSLQVLFPSTTVESISSLALSLLYGPTLMSIHGYWKNHNFDYMDLCWQSNVSAF